MGREDALGEEQPVEAEDAVGLGPVEQPGHGPVQLEPGLEEAAPGPAPQRLGRRRATQKEPQRRGADHLAEGEAIALEAVDLAVGEPGHRGPRLGPLGVADQIADDAPREAEQLEVERCVVVAAHRTVSGPRRGRW